MRLLPNAVLSTATTTTTTIAIITLSLFSTPSTSHLLPQNDHPPPSSYKLATTSPYLQHANHIFNAVHSSMRQWGSSLNHNGMSFFVATVPAGTQLYHGTDRAQRVSGIEWLAFEPEHALIFARGRPPKGGPPPPPLRTWSGGAEEEVEMGRKGVEDRGRAFREEGGCRGKHDVGEKEDWRHGDDREGEYEDGQKRHRAGFEHHGPPPPPPCLGEMGCGSGRHSEHDEHRGPPPPPEGHHPHGPPEPGHGPPPPAKGERPHSPPVPGHAPPPPPKGERPHGRPEPGHGPPPPPEHHGKRPPPPGHGPPPPPHHGERPPPPPPDHHRGPPPPGRPHGGPDAPPPRSFDRHDDHLDHPSAQRPLKPNVDLTSSSHSASDPHSDEHDNPHDDPKEPKPQPGYLHTYVPKTPLRLLYVDGMSAGKTLNGTLDSQDFLLLNLTSTGNFTNGPGSGMWGEFARATDLCALAKTQWEGKIDGILRMEGGFEIIFCEFENLELRSIMPVVEPPFSDPNGPGDGRRGGMLGGWQYYKAITERYHGIGGGRVILDYDNFITAFAYSGLRLWENDVMSDMPMPRLGKAPRQALAEIKEAATAMILISDDGDGRKEQKVNWQEIADEIVTRYSSPLHALSDPTSSLRSSKQDFSTYLATLLRPFIDYTARNYTQETQTCISQFLPPIPPPRGPSLAHMTMYSVAQSICSTLISALDVTTSSLSHSNASAPPPTHALELIDRLVAYLQWTTWKQCGTCADEEICIIPIWPMGSLEDHARPSCQTVSDVNGRGGYWGHRDPRGRRPPPPPAEDNGRTGT